MSGPHDWDSTRLERQRLIERLNAKEAELAESRGGRPQSQLSEEQLEAEIERQRTLNLFRGNFSSIFF